MSNYDTKLLKLAAKAAGIKLDGYGYNPDIAMEGFRNFDTGDTWNPLTDDGDALRLAVKLELTELWFDRSTGRPDVVVGYYGCDSPAIEPLGDDPYAATRRAIVRAAAEIGKAML